MKIVYIIVRVLLSLQLLLSIVFFVLISAGIVPMPEMPAGPMTTFNIGIAASVYMMWLIKLVELFAVIAFLTNRYIVLASVMLFPISLNIFLIHAFLGPDTTSVVIGTFILAGNLFLAYYNRDHYKGLFVAKA